MTLLPSPVAHGRRPRRSRATAVVAGAKTAIITIAGLLGLVMVLASIAPAFGISMVRLETGSMAPTYPAGALLVVRDVSADELAVGDVVTVTRAGHAPITHRIVDLETAGDGAALTLRGDANTSDDPQPYLVQRVGLVVGGVPGIGALVGAAQQPAGVIALSSVAAGVVLWAWWPPRRRPDHRAEPAS